MNNDRLNLPSTYYSPKWVRIISIISVLVIIVLIGSIKAFQILGHIKEGKKKGPPPTTVSTQVTHSEDWELSVSAVTSLTATEGAILATEVSGTIANIHSYNSPEIEKGALLIELDSQVEEAELASSEARVWEAKKALDRATFLAPRQASSKSELDQAEATYRARKAEALSLQAKIERKKIRAPFSGIAGIRLVNVGEYVSQGTPIIPLYKTDPLFSDFSIPQDKSDLIKVGQKAYLSFKNQSFESAFSANSKKDQIDENIIKKDIIGSVIEINPQIDPSSRMLSVRAQFSNSKKVLRPGMFATISVSTGQSINVIPLPETAILYAPYGNSVFVVEDVTQEAPISGIIRQKFVKLGERRGDLISVVSGLKVGERVVNAGTFRLRPDMKVFIDDSIQPSTNISPNLPNT